MYIYIYIYIYTIDDIFAITGSLTHLVGKYTLDTYRQILLGAPEFQPILHVAMRVSMWLRIHYENHSNVLQCYDSAFRQKQAFTATRTRRFNLQNHSLPRKCKGIACGT